MTEIKTVADLRFYYPCQVEGYHGIAQRVAFVDDMVIEIIEYRDMNNNSEKYQRPGFITTELTDKDGTIKVGFVVQRSRHRGCYHEDSDYYDDDTYVYEYYNFDLQKIAKLPIGEIKSFMEFMQHFQRVKALALEESSLFEDLQLMKDPLKKLKKNKYYKLATKLEGR